MENLNEHSAPWDCVFSKDEGDNCLPGEAPSSDQGYFEILCLCLLQAGLNWGSIRKHWARYRKGFLEFNIEKLSRASADELMKSPDVIRNARKIEAVIHNAKEFRALAAEHGSFSSYLSSLGPLPEAERRKALTKRFKQVGPETAEYFLHSVGG